MQFLFLLIGYNIAILIFILMLIVIENIAYRHFYGMISLFRAIIPLILFLGLLSFFFGGIFQVYFVTLRLLIGALSCSIFFALTNPSDLARVFENIKIPAKFALIPSFALTMVPRVSKDAEETFDTLNLRGEIQGFFLRWLPRTLAIFVASILYRSEFLAQSLYFRGFDIQKRTHYRTVTFHRLDLIRIVVWISLILFVYFWKF
jgi:energy-coupling factor transporter transmembrane protein EcfT